MSNRISSIWRSLLRSSDDLRFQSIARPAATCPLSQAGISPLPNTTAEEGPLSFKAYVVRPQLDMALVPASPDRSWMDNAGAGFANRCLPLRIANQAGWMILNSRSLEAIWNGGKHTDDLKIRWLSDGEGSASSHFGHGVLTWYTPYVFQTPPGYNLRMRGPANWCKDGVWPLEGIVETEWSVAGITMNWKVTRPGVPIRFEAGEPICMIYPEKRGEIERFAPEIESIDAVPQLKRDHLTWSHSRRSFNNYLRTPDPAGPKWQRHYYLGNHPASPHIFPNHQVKLKIAPFRDLRSAQQRGCEKAEAEASMTNHIDIAERTTAPSATPALRNGVTIVNEFFAQAPEMRGALDSKFHAADFAQIWNFRTSRAGFFFLDSEPFRLLPSDLVQAFVDRMRAWATDTLGTSSVTPPVLTALIDGCERWPAVEPNAGKYGYVFSLTNWSKKRFSGGEVIVAQSSSSDTKNRFFAGAQMERLFGLELNQLLVFDAHVNRGTRLLRGARTPFEGSVSLEGYIQ
jgi:Family of unknown function (DUF6065)